jgi:hypothetical protein
MLKRFADRLTDLEGANPLSLPDLPSEPPDRRAPGQRQRVALPNGASQCSGNALYFWGLSEAIEMDRNCCDEAQFSTRLLRIFETLDYVFVEFSLRAEEIPEVRSDIKDQRKEDGETDDHDRDDRQHDQVLDHVHSSRPFVVTNGYRSSSLKYRLIATAVVYDGCG